MSSYNPLKQEVECSAKLNDERNATTPRSPTDLNTLEPVLYIDDNPKETPEMMASTLYELNLNSLPFSATDIGTGDDYKIKVQKERAHYQQKMAHQTKQQYKPLTLEEFASAVRLEKGIMNPDDFKVESGASGYNGDGSWQKGCLRDSYRVLGGPPKLPLKIPVGMTNEEFYQLNRGKQRTI
jgi:hypothetical protein